MIDISIVNSTFGGNSPGVPVGPLSVVSSLEKALFRVEFLDYQTFNAENKPDPEVFKNFVFKTSSRVIGLNATCTTLPTVLGAITKIKEENPDMLIILGGPSATDTPKQILKHFPVDIIVYGEGEITAVELFTVLKKHDNMLTFSCLSELATVSGLVLRINKEIVITSARDRVNPDMLPFPAYHHIDFTDYDNRAILITIRGCPYSCGFCSAHSIWKRYVTKRSVESVVAEMKSIANDVEWFEIWDDTFTLDRTRIEKFIEMRNKNGINHPWSAGSRTDLLTPQLASIMSKNGCRETFLGIESGNNEVLDKINKRTNTKVAREAINIAAANFPITHTSYIWGFPFETMDQFLDTIMFIGEDMRIVGVNPQLTMFTPLASSPITKEFRNTLRFSLDYLHSVSNLPGSKLMDFPVLIDLIQTYPDIFTSFYHCDTDNLKAKADIVEKLIQQTAQSTSVLVSREGRCGIE